MGSGESEGWGGRAKGQQGIDTVKVSRAGLEAAKDPLERDVRCCHGKRPRKVTSCQTEYKRPTWAARDAKKIKTNLCNWSWVINHLLATCNVGARVPATTSSFQGAGRKMGKGRSTSKSLSNNLHLYLIH